MTVFRSDATTVHNGDCLSVMATLIALGVRVDSVLTDPPYHLSTVKRFATGAPAGYGTNGLFQRASKGFMGKHWDGGDISFRPETWRLCYDLLKPGGYLMAFAGSRTYHRIACAIEDAGFEIRDQLIWLYGSGLPKSHDQGDGRGTALKPAHEPVCLARKPLIGTVAANILAYGTGALNIDASRVPGESPSVAMREAAMLTGKAPGRPGEYRHTLEDRTTPERYAMARPGEALGRWPANVIHDGSEEVLAAFPNAPGQIAKAGGPEHGARKSVNCYGDYGPRPDTPPRVETDKSAARFFYCAKASPRDRNGSKHPTIKPINLIRYFATMITPPGGTILDPFAGSGTLLEAWPRSILIEADREYFADIMRRTWK